jgi:hypothetical protein
MMHVQKTNIKERERERERERQWPIQFKVARTPWNCELFNAVKFHAIFFVNTQNYVVAFADMEWASLLSCL